MNKLYKKINELWKNAPQYYWGDSLDVRFYLCKRLSEIKNKRILDVGCGPGIIIHFLDKSNEIHGIDNDETAVEIAKKINPLAKITEKDMFGLDFEKDFFDVIILANILSKDNHILERSSKDLIEHIKTFLKPDGKIFFTTPNAENPYYKKRGKFINENYLKKLLDDDFDYKIYRWNPFPILSGHFLKYIPGIFNLLEWLMAKGFRKNQCVSFYVEATKIT